MASNDTAHPSTPGSLPAPEIDLAGAFAPSSTVDHTRGLGGMGRRKRPAASTQTPSATDRGSEAPAAEPAPEATVKQGAGAASEADESLDRERRGGGEEARASVAGEGRGGQKPDAPKSSSPAPAKTPAKSTTRSASAGSPARKGTQRSTGEEAERATGRPSATKAGVAYVPAETRDLLARLRGEKGLTFGESVITALNGQHARLGELVQQRRPAVVDGPLFTVSAKSERAVTVQVALRLSQAHWEVIDRLVEEYGAANRGELIDAAMQAEFGRALWRAEQARAAARGEGRQP